MATTPSRPHQPNRPITDIHKTPIPRLFIDCLFVSSAAFNEEVVTGIGSFLLAIIWLRLGKGWIIFDPRGADQASLLVFVSSYPMFSHNLQTMCSQLATGQQV